MPDLIEVIGTGDDTGATVPGFQRQIVIADECDPDRPSYNCTPAGTLKVKNQIGSDYCHLFCRHC